jgi:hypothetical protein
MLTIVFTFVFSVHMVFWYPRVEDTVDGEDYR